MPPTGDRRRERCTSAFRTTSAMSTLLYGRYSLIRSSFNILSPLFNYIPGLRHEALTRLTNKTEKNLNPKPDSQGGRLADYPADVTGRTLVCHVGRWRYIYIIQFKRLIICIIFLTVYMKIIDECYVIILTFEYIFYSFVIINIIH